MIGQRFGRLVVVGYSHRNAGRKLYWHGKCDCGKSHIAQGTNLKNGNIKSCGCLQKETIGSLNYKHGMRNTTTYVSWERMKQRCLNPNYKWFKDYRGRGITICKEWIDSFENFLSDMGERPAGMSIDRIDNEKGYYKDNCKWSTRLEQNNNKRNNRILTYRGIKRTLNQWARILNISRCTLKSRLHYGWTIKKAFETKVRI